MSPRRLRQGLGDSFDEDTVNGPHTIDVLSDNVTEPDGDPVSLVSVSTDGQGTVSDGNGNQINVLPACTRF